MFVGEDEEVPGRIGGESSEAVVDGEVSVFGFFEDDGEQNDAVEGGVLEQINLAENHIGVHHQYEGRL